MSMLTKKGVVYFLVGFSLFGLLAVLYSDELAKISVFQAPRLTSKAPKLKETSSLSRQTIAKPNVGLPMQLKESTTPITTITTTTTTGISDSTTGYTTSTIHEKTSTTPSRAIKKISTSISGERKNFLRIVQSSKKDLPVRFKSEMTKIEIANISSARNPKTNRSIERMTKNRLGDDYRFCAEEANFLGPYPFLKNVKNPCWDSGDGSLHCVPYFYLAGFSKCGTTDLFARITRHPDIISNEKERHWFDYRRYFKGKGYIDKYASMFRKVTETVINDIKAEGKSDTVVSGDGTPCVIWFSLYWPCYEGNRGLTQPLYTNADVIYRMNPKAKIIVSLRDPVNRLYSRFLTWIENIYSVMYSEVTPLTFHEVCERAVNLYTSCFKEWSPRHCAYNGTVYTMAKLRLQEGMYSIFLADWLKVFPREQILVLKFEDYIQDVPWYLGKIYKFLDVKPLSNETLNVIAEKKARNIGQNYYIGPMLNKTRKLLQQFYSPFNKQLQSLLGGNETTWLWGYE